MVVDDRSDGELIRTSLVDPDLFVVVFERHYDDLFRYLARRVGGDAAPDLASDVFVEAFANRDRFWPHASAAAPWLFGIAANLARRHARSQARRNRAYLRAAEETSNPGEIDAVAGRVDAQRQIGRLNDALGALRGRDREVLLLFALAGLSYPEIAAALEMPVGTVRSSLARTRGRLKGVLDELAGNPTEGFGKGGVR